jgi:hypothetical protein
MENMTPLTLFVLALAVWRVSNLFANEGGPFDLFAKFRVLVGGSADSNGPASNTFAKGLMCEWCNSVWFGTLITIGYLLNSTITFWVCFALCLSTITIMLKFFREMLEHLSTK